MRRRASILAPALLLACLAAGCSRPGPPRFEAVGVSHAGASAEGVELVFHVAATNDSDDPLPLRRVTYSLSLDGRRVFEGVRSPQTTLSRFETHEIDLPAIVPPEYDTRAGAVPYRLSGSVTYLTPGKLAEILFESDVLVPEASLDIAGEIDFGGKN